MSFRLFVYWCALCGGWAAVVGWALGWLTVRTDALAGIGIKGMFLGMLIALALGLVDALWNFALRQVGRIAPRVLLGTLVGSIGGLAGAAAGQYLSDVFHSLAVFQLLGWVITGLMVGMSLGTFDFLRGWVHEEDLRGAVRKVVRGSLGGALGGLLGGFLDSHMDGALTRVFPGKSGLWSPSLAGFVVMGLCIGLWIGVAQVVLQEAWLEVVVGYRAGRELLLTRPVLTIGRAEPCDLGLFGDPAIDRLHARIVRAEDRYLLVDADSTSGTYVNGMRITQPTTLQSGDVIRVGKAVLRFSARAKRSK